jgi:hypothetical protein
MNDYIINTSISEVEQLRQHLIRKGLTRSFQQGHKLVVQQSDAVQVAIRLKPSKAIIDPKFPQIGNSVQIVATFLLFVIMILVPAVGSFLGLLTAVLLGQVISYFYFRPKINALRDQVKAAIAGD